MEFHENKQNGEHLAFTAQLVLHGTVLRHIAQVGKHEKDVEINK